MSDFDIQFRELLIKQLQSADRQHIKEALWDMALENEMLPSDLMAIYNEWFYANVSQVIA